MPQSSTGSVTQECHLRCTKEGNELIILPVSGCVLVEGVLRAEISEHQDHLRFHITDFVAHDGGHYEVRPFSAVIGPNQTQTETWSAPAPGEYLSPTLSRGTQGPSGVTVVVQMALAFEIYGPIVPGATTPPPKAAVVKPPTTVRIQARLGDPELVVAG